MVEIHDAKKSIQRKQIERTLYQLAVPLFRNFCICRWVNYVQFTSKDF